MALVNRVMDFIQTAQPGDCLALSADACCDVRQGIRLVCHRALARRDLVIYCPNEVPQLVRHGGSAEVLRTAAALADRTGRKVMA